ncbi:MAG: hypothetical protein A3B30_04450 [Candidatus Komeilibacteria bacterium RIFCSPLOWO2_01_FULL_52_15]|uniref:DUF218 domain-containing protein n=2 Tax=Candidatus Komeiliibacteriota TaxID=1817908 RepID=A0A1G2BPU9_9BACT|nr:MAG: hypothetical protein A2677_04210 [Candidatus Komeilibacteria bacterium RIFCSPHIGHO2_01_FULL_52_14]OGY91131.1 MAG: hypothetical protein A3B30_04450 [Candidatus Komeilibacteria bacterium RIFCSPLOWO2_01_FULL_52_15]
MIKYRNALVIFGGGLSRDKSGEWHTTNFDEGDNHGVLGDRLRVLAGRSLLTDDPDQLVVVLGGLGQLAGTGAPPVSEVLKKELIDLGVPRRQIITEKKSGTTYQQLQELKKIIRSRTLVDLLLITNAFHVKRVKMMIRLDPVLQRLLLNGKMKVRSAEDVLIQKDSRWKKKIRAAYSTKFMKERIKKEEEGVRQLRSGKYLLK